MLYDPEEDFYLLPRHFARLRSAAQELFSEPNIALDFDEFTCRLYEAITPLGRDTRQRVRVVLSEDLQYHITSTPLPKIADRVLSLKLDTIATDFSSRTLHKSTHRAPYDSARARIRADYASSCAPQDPPFDVLMWNVNGDVTETSIANFAVYLEGSELAAAMHGSERVIQERGAFVTPRANLGLISGVMRTELLEAGKVVEGRVTKEDVLRYGQLPDRYPMVCFNAVRGMYKIRLDIDAVEGTGSRSIEAIPSKKPVLQPVAVPKLFLDAPSSSNASVTPDTTPGLTPVSSPRSYASSGRRFSKSQLDSPELLPVLQPEPPSPFIWRRGVIIDCYDSYTNNLLQLFDQEGSLPDGNFSSSLASYVTILRADQLSWQDFESNVLPHLDFVILSPGPGSPHVPSDIGVGGDLLLAMASERLSIHPIPVLGVCLGHQALAALFGGKVVHAGELVHGRTVPVRHDGTGLFEGLPADQPLHMVRYNSLTVDYSSLPPTLEIIASNLKDGEIMGLKHTTLPLYGVQFHPESVCSRRTMNGIDSGLYIMRNFMKMVDAFWANHGRADRLPLPSEIRQLGVLNLSENNLKNPLPVRQPDPQTLSNAALVEVVKHDIGSFIPSFAHARPDLVFESVCYSNSGPFFWLDSAAAAPADNFARFSYMGPTTHHSCISYDLATHTVSCGTGIRKTLDEADTFWHWMDRVQSDLAKHTDAGNGSEGLRCGFVGYFGYEMKTGALPGYSGVPKGKTSGVHAPDAQFMFADRLLAYDHWNNSWSLLGLVRRTIQSSSETIIGREMGMDIGMSASEFSSWLDRTKQNLGILRPTPGPASDTDPLPLHFEYNSTPEAYKSAIKACQSHIADGNSYELCLTGQYASSTSGLPLDHLAIYKHFRTQNPASHAAFVSFPNTKTTIMSCSPELFIRFDGENGRQAVMKPIKGTLKRSKCRCGGLCKLPACRQHKAECDAARYKIDEDRINAFVSDPKETAENLMIADLIRANLLEFCDPSSVDVTKLFALETYENVYSLVSTIVGAIPPSVGPVEGMRRCFPPGSMTGAPKLRSVQLLDMLETSSRRGIYSGCLGFLSLDDRAVFSVVIRTLIAQGNQLSYGAGGAITWLSEVDGEWAEVVLKAKSVLKGRVAKAE
ncbi:papain cysteine protease family protein [Ceratobasidium sp. AG-Ba]|nr:papain cysteine protease family protein [Ceratobasidium sp. AG-Ba]QRW07938.1 papain cysteine protease family protein [Ceratobasidium sp. AG-Ba]